MIHRQKVIQYLQKLKQMQKDGQWKNSRTWDWDVRSLNEQFRHEHQDCFPQKWNSNWSFKNIRDRMTTRHRRSEKMKISFRCKDIELKIMPSASGKMEEENYTCICTTTWILYTTWDYSLNSHLITNYPHSNLRCWKNFPSNHTT